MNEHEDIFAYKRESVLGMLDRLPAQTRVLVTIPGRGHSEMTVAQLLRQIETLRSEDVGPDVIEKIDVRVLPPIGSTGSRS